MKEKIKEQDEYLEELIRRSQCEGSIKIPNNMTDEEFVDFIEEL